MAVAVRVALGIGSLPLFLVKWLAIVHAAAGGIVLPLLIWALAVEH
jgi:hypothetical protein